MNTVQDPFTKIDKILFGIIPFDEILNIQPADGQSKFEHFLRDDLILGLVDLKWDHLVNTIQFPATTANYFRSGNVLDQLASLLKRIVNSLLDKVGGGSYKLIPDAITTFDNLASQANIRTLAVDLVGKLKTAYDNKLLDTALPILGFFLGWKTDPQTIADPQIWTSFRDGNDYNVAAGGAIDSATTKILFLNNSAGMLETHRNSDVKDHAYDIQIKSVTSDATTNKLTFNYGDGLISPYETLDIKIGGTYNGEEAATITIAYDYVGKDGKAIGGTQYTSRTIFFSNKTEDADITTSKVKVAGSWPWEVGTNAYNKYIFAEDIYNAITTAQVTIYYTNSVSGSTPKSQYEAPDLVHEGADGDMNDNGTPDKTCDDYKNWYPDPFPSYDQGAEKYFDYNTEAESGWPSEVSANFLFKMFTR